MEYPTTNPPKMKRTKFVKYFDEADTDWQGDGFVQGLLILAKYYDITKESIVEGAEHDLVYSVQIDDLIERGVTEEDVVALAKLNWMVEDNDYLQCFV
jgi:hypothetical protein